MICDKKYTTEEAIPLSDKQNIQTKIADIALFNLLFLMSLFESLLSK